MRLLHKQFPQGLWLQWWDSTLMFSIQKGEFVQVLHDGSLHWVCTSTFGFKKHEMNYYDSLSGSCVPWYVVYLSLFIIPQIASIVATVVDTKEAEKQNNSVDGRLNALMQPTFWMGWTQKGKRIRLQIDAHIYFNTLKTGTWKSYPKRPRPQSIKVRSTPLKLALYFTATCPGDQLTRNCLEWEWLNARSVWNRSTKHVKVFQTPFSGMMFLGPVKDVQAAIYHTSVSKYAGSE